MHQKQAAQQADSEEQRLSEGRQGWDRRRHASVEQPVRQQPGAVSRGNPAAASDEGGPKFSATASDLTTDLVIASGTLFE